MLPQKEKKKQKRPKNFTVKLANAAPTRIPFACQMSTCHRKKNKRKENRIKIKKYGSCEGCACAVPQHRKESLEYVACRYLDTFRHKRAAAPWWCHGVFGLRVSLYLRRGCNAPGGRSKCQPNKHIHTHSISNGNKHEALRAAYWLIFANNFWSSTQ